MKQTGFIFKEIKSTKEKAIYSKHPKRDPEELNSFEVIKIRYRKADNIFKGKLLSFKGAVQYPKTSEWGTYGWTYGTLEEAEEKYERI